ncbi:MAG: hypothetical protein JWM10_2269 [Myxococcaceae bacterium]|nr:hypothetical protein [Myxococcaceae bacterium]
MSMKRTKKATGAAQKGSSDGSLGFSPPSMEVPVWEEAVGSLGSDGFTTYAPAQTYKRDALLDHTKFGRGKVLAVDGGRIEVLFSDGVKKLAHGLA